jgi:23S rRNA (cytosine1962-C5)-methyltransferase
MSWHEDLPVAGARRIAVRATADAIRQLRAGSPWLYDGSITSVSHDGAPGDLAVVFDDQRRFVAVGLFDPASPIRIKVLHAGDPATIDADWFGRRIDAALGRRDGLAADRGTTAYRLVHGENDGMPGFVADRYDATVVVKLYTVAWFPHLASVVEALVARTGAERVVLRLGRDAAARNPTSLADGDTLVGAAPDGPVRFRERGLVMEADVVHGPKTGYFLDQRDNRGLVRSMAAGRDVLDVFASTGGFSVSAAAGGARSVHLVDLAAPAIETARRNLEHNMRLREVRECSVRTTVGDAFEVMQALGRDASGDRHDPDRYGPDRYDPDRYDLVIVDPPSFAQNQASIDRALRAYGKLTRLAVALIRPGGMLVQASCSSRVDTDSFASTVHDAARRSGRAFHEVRRTGHPVDHPIGFSQGAYLKAIFARVD